MSISLIIFILGLLLVIFSHPRLNRFLVSRLMNEGLVTPQRIKPEKAELIRFAGPNLSIFFIGVILILIGIIM